MDEDKDVDGDFSGAAADGIDGNVGKKLKINKFKILMAFINCK